MSEKEEKNKNELANTDVEDSEEKLKYPRAIPFIISNEFCERFNFYGMKTILVIYLTQKLFYDDDTATVLYHSFTTMVYFFCIIGAIIADSWLGKFKTILWLSIVYCIGSTVIAIGAIEPWNMPAKTFTILGLFLVALGSGGIKPCVSAFGGEQFKLPQQAAQLAVFFSLFYFSVNAGSLISTSVTPILRDIACFGMVGCFPLAFGVPAVLMIVSIVIFVGGKFLYNIVAPQGNMLVKVFQCIASAIKSKKHQKATNPREHWLEYAETTHGKKLVMETKILLNILVLYLPLPFFWALFDQQGSRWTFQATRMSGDLGFWEIKPDQMQVINPLLILAFIPLYEVLFYPLLSLIGIRRPLQKLTLGGIFAGIAFVISAIVEINLAKTYPVLPKSNEAQLRIFNARSCDYTFSSNIPDFTSFSLKANEIFEEKFIKVDGQKGTRFQWTVTSATPASCQSDIDVSENFDLYEKSASSFFLFAETRQESAKVNATMFEDSAEKSRNGRPLLRVLANIDPDSFVRLFDEKDKQQYNNTRNFIDIEDYPASTYKVFIGDQEILKDVEMKLGGVYTLVINERNSNDFSARLFTISEPNSMHMMWLIPQYVVMTLGEVMFSITGLQFSFTQAPESMKSVLQGCWMLTIAVGNLIVVIIAGAKFFSSQTIEFFLFAGLMFVDMVIFMWLAKRYKAIPLEELDRIDEELLRNEEKVSPLEFNGNKNDGFESKE